jgi:hypothetical protein
MLDISMIVELMFSYDDNKKGYAEMLAKEQFGYEEGTNKGDFNYDLTKSFAIKIMEHMFDLYSKEILVSFYSLEELYRDNRESVFNCPGFLCTAKPIERGYTKSFDGSTEKIDIKFKVSKFVNVSHLLVDNIYEHMFSFNLVVKKHTLSNFICCEASIPNHWSDVHNDELTYSIDDLSYSRGTYMMTFKNKYDVMEKLFKHFLINK